MSSIESTPPTDDLLNALRDDVEPTPALARQRLAERLAGGALLGAGAALTSRGIVHSKAFVVAVSLPIGALFGAAGHAWLTRKPAPVAVVASSAQPAAARPLAERSDAAEAQPPAAAPAAPPASLKSNGVAPRSSREAAPAHGASAQSPPSIERELLLLEQARSRLSEGNATAALGLLRAHQAAYPSSALGQERDALAVRVLWAAGRKDDARRRAAAFVERYPASPLRGSVERAVGKIP